MHNGPLFSRMELVQLWSVWEHLSLGKKINVTLSYTFALYEGQVDGEGCAQYVSI